MTNELKGIAILLVIYLTGEITSRLIGGFMPGSVIGMLLLFILLQTKVVKEEWVKSVCEFVLNNMMLYFVPATAGLMVSYTIISESWLEVIVMLLISTIMVFLVVALVQQFFGKRWRH